MKMKMAKTNGNHKKDLNLVRKDRSISNRERLGSKPIR